MRIAGLIIRVTHITDGKLLCKKIQGGGFEERIFIANFSSTTMKAERAGIQNDTRLRIHEFNPQIIYYTYKLDIFLKYWQGYKKGHGIHTLYIQWENDRIVDSITGAKWWKRESEENGRGVKKSAKSQFPLADEDFPSQMKAQGTWQHL